TRVGALVVLGTGTGRAHVREVHRAVTGGGTRRPRVEVPPGLEIRDAEQDVQRDAEFARRGGEVVLPLLVRRSGLGRCGGEETGDETQRGGRGECASRNGT